LPAWRSFCKEQRRTQIDGELAIEARASSAPIASGSNVDALLTSKVSGPIAAARGGNQRRGAPRDRQSRRARPRRGRPRA
jgi:hypothetical protein